jgi:hypothetical protein
VEPLTCSAEDLNDKQNAQNTKVSAESSDKHKKSIERKSKVSQNSSK